MVKTASMASFWYGRAWCLALTAPRTGLPVTQTAYEVGAAIRWLCPEQTWQIQELGQADPTVPGVTAAIAGYAS